MENWWHIYNGTRMQGLTLIWRPMTLATSWRAICLAARRLHTSQLFPPARRLIPWRTMADPSAHSQLLTDSFELIAAGRLSKQPTEIRAPSFQCTSHSNCVLRSGTTRYCHVTKSFTNIFHKLYYCNNKSEEIQFLITHFLLTIKTILRVALYTIFRFITKRI